MQIIVKNQQKRIPISNTKIKRLVHRTLEFLKVNKDGELTIVYTDNKAIQELNLRFLEKNQSTDVLCFDLSEEGKLAADIVISTQKAEENSLVFKTSPKWEVNLYLIHGILHLLGYKDYRKKDRIRMHKKALQILGRLN